MMGTPQNKYNILWTIYELDFCSLHQASQISDGKEYYLFEFDKHKAPLPIQREMDLWLSSNKIFPEFKETWNEVNTTFIAVLAPDGVQLEKFIKLSPDFLGEETISKLFLNLKLLFEKLSYEQLSLPDSKTFSKRILYLRDGRSQILPSLLYHFFERKEALPESVLQNAKSESISTYLNYFGEVFEAIINHSLAESSASERFEQQSTGFLDQILRLADLMKSGKIDDFLALENAWNAFMQQKEKDREAALQKEKEKQLKAESRKVVPSRKPPSTLQKKLTEISYKLPWNNRISRNKQAILLHELSVMLGVGVPIIRALDILAEQEEHPRLKSVLKAIREKVSEKGTSLSIACEPYPDIFNETILLLIRVGEESGSLASTLENAARLVEQKEKLAASVKQAITGPLITSIVFLFFIFGVVKFVLPQFVLFFSQTQFELPIFSKIVLATIRIGNHSILLLFMLALLILLYKKRKEVFEWSFNQGLKYKFTRGLIGTILGTQFCNIVAYLRRDGVSLLKTLEVITDSSSTKIHVENLKRVTEAVVNGRPLSQALDEVPYFPKVISQMLFVGEKTGKIEELLFASARYMESEMTYLLTRASALIEPLATIFLGIVMGFFFVGLFLPLYQMIGKLST